MNVQDFSKEYGILEKAIVYYTIVAAVNQLHLTDRELQLLAYTNKRGNIASITAKQEFVRIFESSIPSVNNMISKLHKRKLLIKVGKKIIVTPSICPNMAEYSVLQIHLKNKVSEPSTDVSLLHKADSQESHS